MSVINAGTNGPPTATKTWDMPINAANISKPIPSINGIVNTKPG